MSDTNYVDDGPWTHFWDMHSGGSEKLDWPHIFIQADEETATKMFMEAFGRDPENVTCTCCGDDYSVRSDTSLRQLTAFHRNLEYFSPLGMRWRDATPEERAESSRVSRYFEPDEEIPEGWSQGIPNSAVELGYAKPQRFEDFLADPHFESFGRRSEVKIIARQRVTQ